MANLICANCMQEITETRYALPFENIDNVCHEECVEEWFENNLQDVINAVTIWCEESDNE